MRNIILYLFLLLFSFILTGCGNGIVNDSAVNKRDLTPLEKAVVEKSNTFAFKALKEINAQSLNKNLFISPLSLYMALGMTYNGANGTSKDAMSQVLDIAGLSDQEFNESAKSLIQLLVTLDPQLVMKIANSIWIRNGYPVENEFININKNYFNAQVSSIDFTNPNAKEVINNWVKSNTAGYIEKIIDNIPSQMVLYLINAVYFDGKWTYPFDKKMTYTGNFHLPGGSVKPVLMMKQHKEFNTYFGNTFVGVDFPYGNGGFSFTLLLPHENYDVESLIGSLNPEDWSEIFKDFSKQEASISIPKLKFEYEVEDLKEVLTQLGMGICFDAGYADFTRINKDGGLYIDEAKHKTYIEIDEEGTKAAAVTSIGIGRVSLPPQIICDRPFLFIIRENKSESILFIGKVTDPVY